MVDLSGAANLIVAIIEQARADATAPKLCSPGQAIWIRQDASDFLADVVEPAQAECLQDVFVPYRRRPPGGGVRWAFNETDEGRWAARRRQEKRLAGHAGRKRVRQ